MLTPCLLLPFFVALAQPASATPAKGSVPPPAKGIPQAEPASTPDPAKPLVPFPHPLITEVLYNVPTGEGGDANKDGTRQVAGDEFIELVNPHDRPIALGGYTLSDMTAIEKTSSGKPKSGGIKWTFPPITLKPGQVVLVFNGHASTIAGLVGDSSSAPAKPNDVFAGAAVFSMRQPSDRVAYANTADWVMLTAPDGKPVQLIKWGEPRAKVPEGIPLVETAPTARAGSIQRTAANGSLAIHGTDGTRSFSPGVFVMPVIKEPEATKVPETPAKPADVAPAAPSPVEPAAVKPKEPEKKPKF